MSREKYGGSAREHQLKLDDSVGSEYEGVLALENLTNMHTVQLQRPCGNYKATPRDRRVPCGKIKTAYV